jgi:hypothetical protein
MCLFVSGQAKRLLDKFVTNVAEACPTNKNVELGGRDGFKLFPYGVSGYVRGHRRIDGGWHIAIARHLHIFMCTSDLLTLPKKKKIGKAYELLFQIYAALRMPLVKHEIAAYQNTINELLLIMLPMCVPAYQTACNSIKFHWPRHWGDTRRELGCSAAEKSLERKLAETQKRNYKYTNKKDNTEVC